MAETQKTLQVDYFGRIVNISSEELITGFAKPTPATTATLPAADKLTSTAENTAKNNQRFNQESSKLTNLADPKDIEGMLDYLKRIHEELKDFKSKKNTNKEKEPNHQDLISQLEEAFGKTLKKESPWTESRMRVLDKFIEEGTHGKSIHVHDYTTGAILTKIWQELKGFFQTPTGTGYPSPSTEAPVKINYPGATATPPVATTPEKTIQNTKEFNKAVEDATKSMIHHHNALGIGHGQMKMFSAEFQKMAPHLGVTAKEMDNVRKTLQKFGKLPKPVQETIRKVYENAIHVQERVSAKQEEAAAKIEVAAEALLKATTPLEKKMALAQRKSAQADMNALEKQSIAAKQGIVGVSTQAMQGRTTAENFARAQNIITEAKNALGYLQSIAPARFGIGHQFNPITRFDEIVKEQTDWTKFIHGELHRQSGMSGSMQGNTSAAAGVVSGVMEGFHMDAGLGQNPRDRRAPAAMVDFLNEIKEAATNINMTGQTAEKYHAVVARNLQRGVQLHGRIVTLSTQAARLATELDVDAEHTNEMLGDWHMHLGLSTIQTGQMARDMLSISRLTGVTGENLLSAVKSSKHFAENMRGAGTLTSQSTRGLIQLSAVAQRMGTEDIMNPIQEALTNRGSLYNNPQLLNFLGHAASIGGDPQLFRDVQLGAELSQDQRHRLGLGMEERNRQLMRGVGITSGRFEDATAEQRATLNNAAGEMGFRRGFGDAIRAATTYRQGAETTEQARQRITDELGGHLTLREARDRELQIQNLNRTSSEEAANDAMRRLSDVTAYTRGGTMSVTEAARRATAPGAAPINVEEDLKATINRITQGINEFAGPDAAAKQAELTARLNTITSAGGGVAGAAADPRQLNQMVLALGDLVDQNHLFDKMYQQDQATAQDNRQRAWEQRNFETIVREGVDHIQAWAPAGFALGNTLLGSLDALLSIGSSLLLIFAKLIEFGAWFFGLFAAGGVLGSLGGMASAALGPGIAIAAGVGLGVSVLEILRWLNRGPQQGPINPNNPHSARGYQYDSAGGSTLSGAYRNRDSFAHTADNLHAGMSQNSPWDVARFNMGDDPELERGFARARAEGVVDLPGISVPRSSEIRSKVRAYVNANFDEDYSAAFRAYAPSGSMNFPQLAALLSAAGVNGGLSNAAAADLMRSISSSHSRNVLSLRDFMLLAPGGLAAPGVAAARGTPNAYGTPGVTLGGEMPTWREPTTPSPGLGGLPAVPAVPGLGGLPAVPGLGGLPAVPGLGGLPAVPAVPGLGGLPAVPGGSFAEFTATIPGWANLPPATQALIQQNWARLQQAQATPRPPAPGSPGFVGPPRPPGGAGTAPPGGAGTAPPVTPTATPPAQPTGTPSPTAAGMPTGLPSPIDDPMFYSNVNAIENMIWGIRPTMEALRNHQIAIGVYRDYLAALQRGPETPNTLSDIITRHLRTEPTSTTTSTLPPEMTGEGGSAMTAESHPVIAPTEETATPTQVTGTNNLGQTQMALEMARVPVAEPLSSANASLTKIDTNTKDTADASNETNRLMAKLIDLLSPMGGSHPITATNTAITGVTNFWSAALDNTMDLYS